MTTRMPSSEAADPGWRERILRYFTPEMAASFPLTLVRDPDGLMADPVIQGELDRCGFVTRVYDDPLNIRLEYEAGMRAARDSGGSSSSLVILHHGASLQELPFDMLSRARASHREFQFTVPEMFPSVAPAALIDVEPRWLDRLFRVLEKEQPVDVRGVSGSRDLLLREIFGLDIKRLQSASDLLSALCRLHLERHEVPLSLASHLIERLGESGEFRDWPLARLVGDRDGFLAFLQQQWPGFVERLSDAGDEGRVREPRPSYGMPLVPFDDPGVRGWIASLFLEGQLDPAEWQGEPSAWPQAYRWGLREPRLLAFDDRIVALADELSEAMPGEGASYQDWLNFAPRWAELGAVSLGDQPLNPTTSERLRGFWTEVDTSFRAWMEACFGTLELLPKPIMLHRVLSQLPKCLSSENKVALLLMDGMAWSHWIALRHVVAELPVETSVSERSVFAWVPTITPVSRQALFAASAPREFAESISSTAKDGTHWASFWAEEGLSSAAVHFAPPRQNESADSALTRLRDAAEHPLCRALAMIVPTIDEMAHGAVAGASGLQAQVRHWARIGWLGQGLELLLRNGFEVWLTSDHGNLECVGTGRPSEGVLAEQRGVRARVFADETVRRLISRNYPNSVVWPPVGLPERYLALLSSGRTAFATDGEVVVSHGGIALEEVIVPLVRIMRSEP